NAFLSVPRHLFLPKESESLAYADISLPIKHSQTMQSPYIIAKSLDLLEIKKSDKILEIGSGSGYVSALMSKMADKIIGLEIIPELYEISKKTITSLKYANIKILNMDGSSGLIQGAPFNKIIISCALPKIPE